MAFTYSKLAEVTVGSGGATTISFSNVPQNYNDLVIKLSSRTNRSADINADIGITFNSNTSNYSIKDLVGYGTGVVSRTNPTGTASIGDVFATASSATSSTFGNFEIYIPDYTVSANKSVSIDTTNENNATSNYSLLAAGFWSNTTAITSITLIPLNSDSFVQYSTAYLYGVKAEV